MAVYICLLTSSLDDNNIRYLLQSVMLDLSKTKTESQETKKKLD